MDLGAFSISLPVADLATSQAFYEKLGFSVTGGGPEQNYLIMVNGTSVIGLFHGMFDEPILTFNPGLDQTGKEVEPFTDVRKIQAQLEESGLEVKEGVDPANTEGAAHITLTDPDGNSILIDQFR